MSEPVSISNGIAQRYATAIFDLARESKAVDALAQKTAELQQALHDSADLRELIDNPIYPREQQQAAMAALAKKMGLGETLGNALQVMASKRRLFVMPQLLQNLESMIADENGEVTAEITAAAPLSDQQKNELASALKAQMGKDIKINLSVDETLIDGLVIKVGSKMIDTSIRSKLNALQNTMKEVG